MKTLKKLREKLESSPPCQVKPFPRTQCCPFGTYIPCGPPKYKCCLVRNDCQKLVCPTQSCCGPFPDSCTNICSAPSSRSIPRKCCHPCYRCKCGRSFKRCCEPNMCACRCCRKPCVPLCCVYPQMCKPKCCRPCFCRTQPYHQTCIQYTPRCCCCKACKKITMGNLFCGCNTICIPRCCSDATLVLRKSGKTLACSKSVELRGGKLYRGCDCDKKNGLQDRCLRFCCINNPKCRTQPASCHCSKFSCGKHLKVKYGKKKSSYTCYVCGPPKYPCVPCCHAIYCCPCCCQKKCENSCQCCPATCEVECCCQACPPMQNPPCPEPCLPCSPEPEPCCLPTSCPEPYKPSPEPCKPCPEPCCLPLPCEPCPEPCCATNSHLPRTSECPCENACHCDGGTQTNGTCYIEYGTPQCIGCQTNHY